MRASAEWARGISPRASHRSGLDTLASSGSCHRAKAAAFRRELELLLLPVGSLPTSVACPLRSTGITPLQHYYGAVRPSPAHQYFRPRGWSRLCLFPWHRRPGSHVPYKSQIEVRAASMPDAAWAVSGHPPSYSQRNGNPPVLASPNPLSTRHQRFACARLSQSCLPKSCFDFSATFTTIAFDDSSLRWLETNT